MHANPKLIITAVLALGLCAPAHAAPENTPEPGQRYEVVDIAAGNTLNIRAQPNASAKVIGKLAAGSADVSVAGTRAEANGSVWWQVIGPKGLGWVNARYLAPTNTHGEGEQSFPLRCLGTEPFWSLTVDGGQATLKTPDAAETWAAGEMKQAEGMLGRYAIRLETDAGVGHLAAWRNHAFCSDGMSDIGYPFEGIVAGPDGSVRGGCCMRAP